MPLPEWAINKLIPADLDRVDVCPEGCNSAAFIKLIKEKKEDGHMTFEELKKQLGEDAVKVVDAEIAKAKTDGMEEGKKEGKQEMKGEMDKKDAEIAELQKKCGKKPVAKSEEEVLKEALAECDPVIKAMFEKMQAKEQAAEAAAKIAKEKAVEDAAIAKAKEFANLNVKEDEMVAICKSLNSLEDKGEKVYAILKAVNNIDGAAVNGEEGTVSIFKSVGANGEDTTSKDAWGIFQKEVAKVAKERKITEGEATLAVMKEKPELYTAYLDSENE